MAKGIHLEADSTTQEFKLYNGKGGLYIGKAVLKNNVFVLDFVLDLGTADSDGIVTFTSWTHPPDLDPDFRPEGFWYSHTIPETERTRALATIQHSTAAKTTSTAAETTSTAAETTSTAAKTTSTAAEITSAAAETTAAVAAPSTPIAGPSTASAQIDNKIDDAPPTPAQQLNPTSREGGERYFLLVVDDYMRYTTVFALQSKADVRGVLIRWIRAVRLQLYARFQQDLLVPRLHSNRGGEFCSHLLEDFCGAEGIVQSYTLPVSPQQNGITECRIGLVMEVARTSMFHAAAPHFLWPFAVQYAAEQLNLWPRVSHLETSPTLRWAGEVGNALAFRVWGSLSLVRDLPAGKLSPRTLQCVFLGFPTDAPPWQFYHPGSHCVLSSRDVTFD
ncbi:unnamed protein product, partial [Closterium sp. NIES-54]